VSVFGRFEGFSLNSSRDLMGLDEWHFLLNRIKSLDQSDVLGTVGISRNPLGQSLKKLNMMACVLNQTKTCHKLVENTWKCPFNLT